MCGIAGIVKYNQSVLQSEAIQLMTQCQSHRGPDAEGYYENQNIALGHNRLSIIDLSDNSNQPMTDHTGRYHIVFNGEIYNYKEISEQLTSYPFSTQGDTEVILAAYATWGPSCLERFAGMFAFGIWDSTKKQLFIARDRLGVKPLYYYASETVFLFASEIKALLASGLVPKSINRSAIARFLQYQSIGYPDTIITGIRSLEAGSYMTIDDQNKTKHKYWNIFNRDRHPDSDDPKKIKSTLKTLLMQSVRRRMVSDVPVAAFLSGGIDSSAIVGLMSAGSTEPINTFTVGFHEEEFDESPYAEKVAKKFNTRHERIMLRADTFMEQLLPALDAMDTPTGDGVNNFVICRAIRNRGIKVALSGVGGDELFAGYPIFRQYLKLMRFKNGWPLLKPFRHLTASAVRAGGTRSDRLKQMLKAGTPGISEFYPAFRQIVSNRMLAECSSVANGNGKYFTPQQESAIEAFPLLSQVSIAEYLGYTQHTLLTDMDQMSMASSLEVREPYFDHELIEFVLDIPDRYKSGEYPKQLLVETLDDMLPSEIVHRKKQGFVFPWNTWLRNDLRSFCEGYLSSLAEREFIRREGLMKLWHRFLQNDPSVRWMEIWLFVVLEYWLQKNNVE